jgi:hypothetical protein
MNSSTKSESTVVYPFCYKIKETCNVPTGIVNEINASPTDCLTELSRISKMSESYIDANVKDKNVDDLFNCLLKYGDIYKKLNIELFVNPKSKQAIFPDNARIQSNLNLFLKETDFESASPKKLKELDYKLMLYNILLNDNLRQKYNEFYYSIGFSDLSSVMPKEYGISRIMGKEEQTTGGKRRKKRKTNKNKKLKRKSKKNR